MKKRFSKVLTAATILGIAVFVGTQLFPPLPVSAATYFFTQVNWSGGISSATMTPANVSGWTNVSSTSNIVAATSTLTLATATYNQVQTNFSGGTFSSATTTGGNVAIAGGSLNWRKDFAMTVHPYGSAFDPITNSMWITDGYQHIYKTNVLTGASTTYAVGSNPYNAVFDSYTNSIWVSNTGDNTVSKVNVLTGTSTVYSVGSSPEGMTFDPVTDSVWVTDTNNNTVSKVNVLTGTSTVYGVGTNPNAAAFDSYTNSVWVTNYNGANVTKVNILTGASSTYSVGTRPDGIAFDSVTDSIWVANHDSNTISKVNVLTGTSTAYGSIGNYPGSVIFDPVVNAVWVENNNSILSKVNITTGAVTQYSIGPNSTAAAFDSYTDSIWASSYDGEFVSRVSDSISPFPTISGAFNNPGSLTMVTSTGFLWAANSNNNTVSRTNVLTGTSTFYSMGSGINSTGFDPISNSIWVTSNNNSTVYKVNMTTGTSTGYTVGTNPDSSAFDPINNMMWITNYGSNNISEVNVLTGTSTAYNIGASGSNPDHDTFEPITNSVWTSNNNSTVTKLNVQTLASTTYSSPGGAYLGGTGFDPVSNSIWVLSGYNNYIDRINPITGTSTAYSPNVLSGPDSMTFDPTTNSMWVTNYSNNTVSQINVLTGVPNGTYYVGTNPDSAVYDSTTNSIWVSNNNGNNITRVPLYVYPSSATFTSGVMDFGVGQNFTTFQFSATTPASTTIQMNVRAGNTATPDGTWTSWQTNVSNGGSIAGLAGNRYVQYQAVLGTSNIAITPTLSSVTVNYSGYQYSGSVISNTFNTGDPTNVISGLSWTEATSSGNGVALAVSGASSTVGLGSSWTTLTETSTGCSAAGSAVTCSAAAILAANPALGTSGSNQYWQYRLTETSNGVNTPTVSSIGVQYVINAPPQFNMSVGGGTGVAVSVAQNATSTAGRTTFQFSAKDPDADTDGASGGHATSTATPSYQYSLNGGTSWSPMNSFITANATSDITLSTSTYSPTSSIIWNAKADAGSQYTSNAMIMVTLDDHQPANHIATATTAAFTLDTQAPTVNSFSLNASAQTAQFNLSDNSNLLYRISGSSFTTNTPTSSLPFVTVGGTSTSTNAYAISFASTSSPVLYLEVQDIYGNDTYQTLSGPPVLSALVAKDVSNRQIGNYQVYLSWASTTIGNFRQYDIFRSTGGAYVQVGTTTSQSAANFTDMGLSPTTAYYYEVRVEDTNGDISAFTGPAFVTPTGNGGGPAISGVAAVASDTSAAISWSTNIAPQSSYVFWSQSPSMASPFSVAATIATSGAPYANTATLTNLTPSATYYYYVQSTDSQGNTSIDNNGGSYYSFQATNNAPPVISNIQLTPTQNSADIRWTTNKAANSAVFYGLSSGQETSSASSSVSLTTTPEVLLTNLQASTTYYYYLQSVDALNHTATTSESFFTTSQFGPVISSVVATPVSTSTATITWTTNKAANSYAFYATSTGATFTSVQLSSTTTSHAVPLSGLTPSTTYYFYVQSTDQYGNVSTDKNGGSYYSFATTKDTVPPAITNILVQSLGQTVATISWMTDKGAASEVFYGTSSASYAFHTTPDPTLVTAHSVSLASLAPATIYYYEVSSTDAYGNVGTSSQQSLTTLTLPGPTISSVAVASTSDFGATITWSTNTNSDSHIYYATATSSFTLSAGTSGLAGGSAPYSHSVTLGSLTPGATYYFYVQSTDAQGNTTIDKNGGSYYTFVTTNSATPNLYSVQAGSITSSSSIVTWTTDKLTNDEVLYGTSSGIYPSSTAIGDVSPMVTAHSVTLQGLAPGTKYYYVARSTDSGANTGTSPEQSFTTINPSAPVISSIAVASTSDFGATVTWNTDTDSDSHVYYSTATSSFTFAAGSSSLAPGSSTPYLHTVTLQSLTASTTYYFYVQSTDAFHNTATNNNSGAYYSLVTTNSSKPVISSVTVVSPGQTTAGFTWVTNKPANSQVLYGTSSGSYTASSSISDVSFVTSPHSVSLTGLIPATTYYFVAQSVDSSGNVSTSTQGTFATLGSQGPVISEVSSTPSDASAQVSWMTDTNSNSFVFFGTSTAAISLSAGTASLLGGSGPYVHAVTVPDLTASTTYYYYVQSTDASGSISADQNNGAYYTFTTEPAFITNVSTTYVGDTEAIIDWETSGDSNSYVHYFQPVNGMGSVIGVGTSTFVGGSAPYQHSILVDSLTPGTTYEFYLESDDGEGNDHIANNDNQYYNFTTTDHTPPVISAVATPVVSQTAAIVTWTTDRAGTSLVDYGTATGSYGSSTVLDPTLTTYHAVPLSGLAASTTYYFQVHSQSDVGVDGASGENTFSTLPVGQTVTLLAGGGGYITPPDTTPPKISGVTATTTPFTATVTFATDESALGFVDYGTSTSYGYAASDGVFGLSHTVTVPGLVIGTTYHFLVKAVDKAGNTGTSTDSTFQTQYLSEATLSPSTTFQNAYDFQQEIENSIASALPTLIPPFLSTPAISDITENSATVSWTTNINSYSIVSYATDAEYNASTSDPYAAQASAVDTKTTNHAITLTGLVPNTVYHVMAESFSLPGLFGKSSDITFTTAATKVVAQISKVTPSGFRVSWTTDVLTNSVVQYKDVATGITQTITDDTPTTAHSIDVGNLLPAHSYVVSVSGSTAQGNVVAAATSIPVETTKDLTPPVIANIKIQTIIDPQSPNVAQAIVGWTTDKPANSVVRYDQGVSSPSETFSHVVQDLSSYTQDHVVILPNLVPGAVYRVQISSIDEASNTTVYPTQTIVVSEQSQSILDVILNNFENTFQFLHNVQP